MLNSENVNALIVKNVSLKQSSNCGLWKGYLLENLKLLTVKIVNDLNIKQRWTR